MKKYAFFAAIALTSAGTAMAGAIATPSSGQNDVCTGGTAAKYDVAGGSGQPYTTADSFIKTGFSVSCSTNSFVSFSNVSGTLFTIGSGSGKGNQSFKGSSNGGAVTVHLKCTGTNDACTQANAQTANTAAASM